MLFSHDHIMFNSDSGPWLSSQKYKVNSYFIILFYFISFHFVLFILVLYILLNWIELNFTNVLWIMCDVPLFYFILFYFPQFNVYTPYKTDLKISPFYNS